PVPSPCLSRAKRPAALIWRKAQDGNGRREGARLRSDRVEACQPRFFRAAGLRRVAFLRAAFRAGGRALRAFFPAAFPAVFLAALRRPAVRVPSARSTRFTTLCLTAVSSAGSASLARASMRAAVVATVSATTRRASSAAASSAAPATVRTAATASFTIVFLAMASPLMRSGSLKTKPGPVRFHRRPNYLQRGREKCVRRERMRRRTRTDALVPQPETGKISCVRHVRCGRLSPGVRVCRRTRPASRCSRLFHGQELDVEHQRRVRWDDAAGAGRAVAERGRDDQGALAADLHRSDALVPALDDAAAADRKLERLVAVMRTVEFLALHAVDVEPAGIVHDGGLARFGRGAGTDCLIDHLKSGCGGHDLLSGGLGGGWGGGGERHAESGNQRERGGGAGK